MRQTVSGATGLAYWSGAQFGPDVEAHLAIPGNGIRCCQISMTARLLLRVGVGSGGLDGYELLISRVLSGWGFWIRRLDDGVETNLTSPGYTDEWNYILFRAIGSKLQGWGSENGVDWYKGPEVTDTTYSGPGRIGLGIGLTDPVLDDFGGGTLSPVSPGGPPVAQGFGLQDGGCGSVACAGEGTRVEPVNTFSGAFVHAETDLSLASTGVPFEWTRSYTSADTASGRFGQGWTDTYQASLAVQPSGDVVAKGDEGQRLVFTALGGGAFQGAPGSRASLTTVAGGYRLTTNDQLVYEFDPTGKLLSKKDRNGQGVTLVYDGNGRLATVTDSAGRVATVSYTAGDLVSGVALSDGRSVSYGYTGGRLTSFTDVRGKQWSYGYDVGGRLTTITDPLGHAQVTNVYDATSGRVTSQTDATGKTTQFAWDAATETATVTDPRGHVWKDVYVDGVLSKRTDGTGRTTEFGFDGNVNDTSVKSPAGETTSMTYDASGNMLSATAPASLGSAQKTFVYNARNDPTTVTDARGTVTSYTYTPAGNVETVTQGGQQQAAYTYDAAGRVLTATDANGKTTTYTYDAAGNVASVTQPDPDGPGPLGQPKTTFTYDSQGNVLTRVDPKGNVAGCGCAGQYTTTFTYNPAGQLLTETDPLGHATTNVYDDAGRVTATTDSNGHTTGFTYDNANRTLTVTSPDPDGGGPLAAPVTTYAYDDAGNKATETDPRGNTATFGYDDANRLVSTTGPDPDGAGPLAAPLTTYAYDVNGNLSSSVEPRGNLAGANPNDYKTTYTYDAAGRLLTTTDPLGHAMTNVYDAVGSLASVTDANGHAMSYTYDYAGRVLTVTAPDPDGAGPLAAPVTSYTYDAAGNRLSRTDANGHVTTWVYDALDRPVSETMPDPDGAGGETPSVTTMAYDPNGNLLSTIDANGNGTPASGDGTTVYGYDRANRPTAVDYSDSTPDVTFTLDNVGNRLSMTDGAGTEARSYDNLDRLLSVARGANTFSYRYDPAGNVTRRTYPDGTVTDYTFDALGRLASAATGTLATSYAYDAASNQTGRTTGGHELETRAYDRAGRLVDLDTAWGGSAVARFQITRDPVGNPTEIDRTGDLTETQTYGYDNMDRLTSVCFEAGSCPGGSDPFVRWAYDGVGNRLSEQRPTGTVAYTYDGMDRMLSAGSASFGYDRNGNQTSARYTTLGYDLADRLVSWTHGDATMTYLYDGDGTRLSTTVSGGTSPGVTNFLWDRNNPLPELAVEQNGAGQPVRRYLYGAGPVALTTPSATNLYVQDPLGSTANLLSVSGAVTKSYSYEPFGTTRTESGSLEQPLRFTGQYHDPTELYHLRARQYDPQNGRFLSGDPAALGLGSPVSSTYVYANNLPTALVDPSGMGAISPGGGSRRLTAFASSPTDLASCLVLAIRLDCGPRAFASASWNQRLAWLLALDRRYELRGWLDVFRGIVTYFRNSRTFRTSSWASLSDAYVLWAVQGGLAQERSGDVRSLWAKFFQAFRARAPEAALRSLWGNAEQGGVDFGTDVADQLLLRPGGDEGELIAAFIYVGDLYRSAVAGNRPLTVGVLPRSAGFRGTRGVADPRLDRQLVYSNAQALERCYGALWECLLPG